MSDEEGSPRAVGSDREDEPMKVDGRARDDARSASRERSASPVRDKSRSRSPMRSRSRSPVASPVRSPVVRRHLFLCWHTDVLSPGACTNLVTAGHRESGVGPCPSPGLP